MLVERDIGRLLSKIDRRGDSECWPYLAAKNSSGHGAFWAGGASLYAHRAIYFHLNPDTSEACVIRHACDNPACCNPKHLVAGTQIDNIKDRVGRERSAVGARNGRSKLSAADIIAIRGSNKTSSVLAKSFGVTTRTIRSIRALTSWRHIAAPGHRAG